MRKHRPWCLMHPAHEGECLRDALLPEPDHQDTPAPVAGGEREAFVRLWNSPQAATVIEWVDGLSDAERDALLTSSLHRLVVAVAALAAPRAREDSAFVQRMVARFDELIPQGDPDRAAMLDLVADGARSREGEEWPGPLDGVWPEELRSAMGVIEEEVSRAFSVVPSRPLTEQGRVTDAFTQLKAYIRRARQALRPAPVVPAAPVGWNDKQIENAVVDAFGYTNDEDIAMMVSSFERVLDRLRTTPPAPSAVTEAGAVQYVARHLFGDGWLAQQAQTVDALRAHYAESEQQAVAAERSRCLAAVEAGLMDAIEQAVRSCVAQSKAPTETWHIDYADISAAALDAVARRIATPTPGASR